MINRTPLVVVAILLLAACGTDRSSAPAPPSESLTTSPGVTPTPGEYTKNAPNVREDIVASMLGGPTVNEEDVIYTPEQLAALPDVQTIVVGTVNGFAAGPRLFAESTDDPNALPTMVMSVNVTDTLKGEPPASGKVYVQFQGLLNDSQATAALPAGTLVGLYLETAPQEDPAVTTNNTSAGRPDGEPVWQVGPRGFVVADGVDSGVVLPVAGVVQKGADFDDKVAPTK